MTGRDDHLVLNQAASQADRWLDAPDPARAQVDSRSTADLLSFAAEYGALIIFYNQHDRPDGYWSTFFINDESIRLALRAGLDPAKFEAELDRVVEAMLAAGSYEARLECVQVAIAALLRLVRLLDLGDQDPRDLEDALVRLGSAERTEHLRQPARRLAMHLSGQSPEDALRRDLEAYSGDWFRAFVDYLSNVIAALITALEQMRPEAAQALEASYSSRDHAPQSGLYDAFAMLFRHAQNSVNRFSGRFAEFYRAEALKQTSRGGSADQLNLVFTAAKGVTRLSLPRGAGFTAGQDAEGETIAYALDNALEVCSAELKALGMFTVTALSLPAPGPDGQPTSLPAQVFTSVATLAPKPPRIAEPFPIFGATTAGKSDVLTTALASLGFAVASPTLLLAGGSRTVRVGLTLTADSLAAAFAALGALGVPADAQSAALVQLLQGAFALRYSTNGGWISLDAYGVDPPSESGDSTYTLVIDLDSNAPPVAPLSGQPPDPAATPPVSGSAVPDPDTPTLMADLRQSLVQVSPDLTLYPYAILAEVVLSGISLSVAVKGLGDLRVSNTGAPVDTTRPFLVFGSPPTANSTLDIWSPELFGKTLSSFTLNLDWFGLPVDQQGFYNYYFAYVIDANGNRGAPGSLFDNTTFKSALAVKNPGLWTLGTNSQQLFRTEPPSPPQTPEPQTPEPPNPEPRGTLAPGVSMSAPVSGAIPPAMYDLAGSSVQLSLTNPDYAFGNTLYAANVMEASVQLTAAASSCAQQCGNHSELAVALGRVAQVSAVAEGAPDDHFEASLKSAVSQAVAGLDGDALNEIGDATASLSDATARSDLKASLSAALAASKGPTPSLVQRLTPWRDNPPDAAGVHASVDAWLATNASTLAAADPAATARAQALLEAGDGLSEMLGQTATLPPAVSRPVAAMWLKRITAKLEAALGVSCQDCIQKCLDRADLLGLPNTPWLPMASSLSVDYGASATMPALDESARFYWLEPFNQFSPAIWSGVVPEASVNLLPPLAGEGGLYIELSDPADALTLLFQLSPPAGGWPADTPEVVWSAQSTDRQWTPITPVRDTTNGLRNPGIVNLALDSATTWLRVSAPSDAVGFPELAGLIPNAATATWVGPGGAAQLGTPLAAGSVNKAVQPNPDLGAVWQPEPSTGGRPRLAGRAFDMWLAERLRHKDRAIDGWDYSRLVLAEFPSLWQVAVVPASDGAGAPARGSVWVSAVPGPSTSGIADPTEPTSDGSMLEAIEAYLSERISPFIKLAVTNPPYRRLTVTADVIFTDVDTAAANEVRLNNDLIKYLSPWPTGAPRARDYYTRRQVAFFIRHRPYVRGIRTLELTPDPGPAPGWSYLTSALAHNITGTSEAQVRDIAGTGAPEAVGS